MNSAHVFFKEGKLYLIPELPTEQHNLHLPVEIEKAKANALPVVNPEVADKTELPFPGNRIVRLRKENENFEWPGTWEKVREIFVVNKKSHTKTSAKLIAPQQPQAEDDDRRGWPEHEEPIPNNKPTSWNFETKEASMTQSDAPNEIPPTPWTYTEYEREEMFSVHTKGHDPVDCDNRFIVCGIWYQSSGREHGKAIAEFIVNSINMSNAPNEASQWGECYDEAVKILSDGDENYKLRRIADLLLANKKMHVAPNEGREDKDTTPGLVQ